MKKFLEKQLYIDIGKVVRGLKKTIGDLVFIIIM